jgi:hypothetical protein
MSRVGLSGTRALVRPLQGKIAHWRNLHGNEKEGKKEETLTVSEDDTSLTPNSLAS